MSWDLSTLDPGDDFDLFDGKESVSFEHYRSGPPESYENAIDDVTVLFRSIKTQVFPLANGESVSVNTRIHVKTSSLITKPSRRSRFTREDGRVYVVWAADMDTLGTRYMCDCYEQSEAD